MVDVEGIIKAGILFVVGVVFFLSSLLFANTFRFEGLSIFLIIIAVIVLVIAFSFPLLKRFLNGV